jgi:RNA polymerase sigma factor (sigma-70 family)
LRRSSGSIRGLVYGIAERECAGAGLAADCCQAVFVVFVRRVGTIRHARALPSWFVQTTRYAVLDAKRNARRREHHERQAALARHARAEQIMDSTTDSSDRTMLEDAISRLRKCDREVVAMRFLQGQEVGAIAVTLGIGSALEWRDFSYEDRDLPDLWRGVLDIPWYSVIGIEQLTFPPMNADFVVDAKATPQQRLDAVAALLAERTTQKIRFVRGQRKMLCMVVQGKPRPLPKDKANFNILVMTQAPLDGATLKRWIDGWRPRGSTHGFDVDQVSDKLGAPLFVDVSPRDRGNLQALTLVAADAQIKPTDPEYPQKLRRILDNVQMQTGAEWRMEERELEVFTVQAIGG